MKASSMCMCTTPTRRYGAFLTKYTQIITNVCSLLRTGHTATFVVGNIRSKTKGGDGRMLPLHMHTTQAFDKVCRLVSKYCASVLGWGSIAELCRA